MRIPKSPQKKTPFQVFKEIPIGTVLTISGEVTFFTKHGLRAFEATAIDTKAHFVGLKRRFTGVVEFCNDPEDGTWSEFHCDRSHLVIQWRHSPTAPLRESLIHQVLSPTGS